MELSIGRQEMGIGNRALAYRECEQGIVCNVGQGEMHWRKRNDDTEWCVGGQRMDIVSSVLEKWGIVIRNNVFEDRVLGIWKVL